MRLQLARLQRLVGLAVVCFCGLHVAVLRTPSAQGEATPEVEPPPAGEKAPAPERTGDKRGPVQASIDLRSGVYQDSDHTTISTSTIAARALIKERGQLEARYLVDVVSSASVDVVTAATGRFIDIRHEVTAGGGYRDGTNSIAASYIYSRENDWWSHTVNLGGARDFLQHNLTLGLGGSIVLNDVGRSHDQNFHRSLNVYGVGVSAGYTATRRDLLQFSYSFSYLAGYQASPYRYVIYVDDSGFRASEPEHVPDARQRHALVVRWNRHLLRNTALQLHARGYYDDWEVASGTLGGELLFGVGRWVLAPRLRGYVQRHAGFYQPLYMGRSNFMTFDRELSTFIDGFLGFRAGWFRKHLGPLDELRAELKVDGFGFYFFDFPRLQSRYGLVAELALGVSL